MLEGVNGLVVLSGGIELEGNAEGDSGISVKGEFAVEVTQVHWCAHWCHVFGAITKFVSCAFATKTEGSGARSVTFGIAFLKGRFGI